MVTPKSAVIVGAGAYLFLFFFSVVAADFGQYTVALRCLMPFSLCPCVVPHCAASLRPVHTRSCLGDLIGGVCVCVE